MSSSTSVPRVALLLLGTVGCKEYFSIEEACDEGFVGKNNASPEASDAFNRVNCYRRLTGVSKATWNAEASDTAEATMNYILSNPDSTLLLGVEGIGGYLTESAENDGFTGVSVEERLDRQNYFFFSPLDTAVWEGIAIHYRASADIEAYTTERAVDELFRITSMRQGMLQPSLLDAAYAELELDQQWLSTAGASANSATVYYWMIVHSAPHLEHVDRPVMLPKEDQKDVPLYAKSVDISDPYAPVATLLGWPITFLVGSLDETNYRDIDQNPYEVAILSHSLVDTTTNEAIESHVVHPGDDASDRWPDANRQRWIAGIYPAHPYTPSTKYEIHAEMTTVDGDWTIDYAFTTAAEDPGYVATDPTDPTPPAEARIVPSDTFLSASKVTSVGAAPLPADPSAP